ncbi:MAG: hypothetical protein ABW034_03400 [Steroidobacteraceae bacterium]
MPVAISQPFGRQRGNAIAEAIVAMLALSPLLVGIPLLGKQLDIKHKTYDATRYAVWERTVWSDQGSNRKSADDITLEARDRALGNPTSGVLTVSELRSDGISENPLWVDREQRRLLNYSDNTLPLTANLTSAREPVRVGVALVPTMAYEGGTIAAAARLVQLEPLGMTDRAFARTNIRLEVRPKLAQIASRAPSLRREAPRTNAQPPLIHEAAGAVLSDSWSARDEANLRSRVDRLTVNEAISVIELPSRPIGALAIGKGKILYGEGQYSWDPEFKPRSTTLPRAYVHR